MTVDEITNKIMEFGDLHSLSGVREEIYRLINQVSPREVSNNEIEELALQFCENEAPKTDPLALRQARFDGYLSGFQEAMQLNAMAKLESLWPSDEEVLERAKEPSTPIYDQHSLSYGFRKAACWLKARVLGGEK